MNVENPHAFPRAHAIGDPGMTLLDYIAVQALVGVLANSVSPWPDDGALAQSCYALAQAMLSERVKILDAAPSPDDINERGRR